MSYKAIYPDWVTCATCGEEVPKEQALWDDIPYCNQECYDNYDNYELMGVQLVGADDYHVSMEARSSKTLATLEREISKRKSDYVLKRIEHLAYKWFDGEITDKRMAEAVFGLINKETHDDD